MWFKITWLVVTYILWGSVFYTSINIPYGSMASAISAEPEDRQSLSTFRTLGSSLAGVVIGAGVPLLAYDKRIIGDNVITEMNGQKFTVIAGVFSLLAIVAYILCYFLTTERVISAPPEKKSGGIVNLVTSAVQNRSLISIIAASVIMLLSQFTLQQMSNYVYPDYYANTSAQSAATVAMLVGMIISAAVAKPLTRKFGKAELSTVASAVASAICVLLFLLRPKNVWIYVGLNFFSWLGLGIFSMVSWALITDVIDDAQIKRGVREDGTIYALYSFARKLGQAAAAGLTGLLLTSIGYEKIPGEALAESVKNGIFNISSIVPAIGFALLAAVLWFWYPLHKSRVDENVKRLREMRKM